MLIPYRRTSVVPGYSYHNSLIIWFPEPHLCSRRMKRCLRGERCQYHGSVTPISSHHLRIARRQWSTFNTRRVVVFLLMGAIYFFP
ncbi:hypothetical protein DAEQUDRAFT_544197 [Daedalea quercina L-15889]|uniref:Uncharacterized protein n=1 Tax=Daedalea quercina L-15889 TaxID=1314783 RepID=A0A165T0K7_9APHY|nr:hypothetical protein DAEQUDRAFT_544197 [Daedalea quercina L-15889]